MIDSAPNLAKSIPSAVKFLELSDSRKSVLVSVLHGEEFVMVLVP
jgi:hypothetical protein